MANPVKWLRSFGRSVLSVVADHLGSVVVSAAAALGVAMLGWLDGLPAAVVASLAIVSASAVMWGAVAMRRLLNRKIVAGEQRQDRKRRIEKWREFLANYDRERDGPLSRTAVYSEMRPDLQPRVVKHIEGRTIVVHAGSRGGSLPMLLDEVTRLEREWDLI